MVARAGTRRHLAALSGVLLYFSLPSFDLSFVAWIALVPLLVALRQGSYREAFLLGMLAAAVAYGLHVRWALDLGDLPFVSFLLIILYASLYVGVFGVFYLAQVRRCSWPAPLAAALLWVALEFIRSNLSFLAWPFALLGYSQYQTPAILQLASVTGVYGISFLIVLVNEAIAEAALWASARRTAVPTLQKSGLIVSGAVIAAVVLVVLLWGSQRANLAGTAKTILTVSLVQGNIPQKEKWDAGFRKKIEGRYRELTLKASQDRPDLIIWPESATPGYLRGRDPSVYRAVKELVGETGTPLLVGSASHAKIHRAERREYRLRNSVFLLDSGGKIVSGYDKMRLLPFGEYLPLEGRFPWPRWIVPDNGTFTAGNSATVFELLGRRFGVVICWEIFFPNLFRTFVNANVDFMVNPTNEAWFDPEASRQFLSMSVFRAVENGVTLLRAANTGITSLIDPLGNVRDRVRDGAGNDIMVAGVLTVSVPPPIGPTFYTRYGDLFAVACMALSAVFLITAIRPGNMRRLRDIAGHRQSGISG